MIKRVAIENNLDNVKEYLEKKGISVEMFDDTQLLNAAGIGRYDAVIISGGNKNFLGIEDITTNIPVIDARGMTPKEIYDSITK